MTTVVQIPLPTVDVTFPALGTDVRVIVTGRRATAAVDAARTMILDYHARLSRFRSDSEICALNRDPRAVVPASALLRSAVRAGIWAAERSDGLVDPCLLDALEDAGYTRSLAGSRAQVVPTGTPRPAKRDPARRWQQLRVDDTAQAIERPPGLRIDLGGSGKGHVADLVAGALAASESWVVDCGGDIRIGGAREVQIEHPLYRAPAARAVVVDGAVATSSVVARAWHKADGRTAHHLLDPATGAPVWTGLLTASAFASTTLEAETLAKVALLTGADGARTVLARHGGVLVHADGQVETIGAIQAVAA